MLNRIKSEVVACAYTLDVEIIHAVLRVKNDHALLLCSIEGDDRQAKALEKELRLKFAEFAMCKSSNKVYASNFVKVVTSKRLLILLSICRKSKCDVKDIWIDKDNKLREGML